MTPVSLELAPFSHFPLCAAVAPTVHVSLRLYQVAGLHKVEWVLSCTLSMEIEILFLSR